MPDRTAHIIDEALVAELANRLRRRSDVSGRVIVGIAGIPAAGKSTLGRLLLEAINQDAPGAGAGAGAGVLVPMDGYHLTNRHLDGLGLRNRKGAPATFDARGYCRLLEQARDPAKVLRFPIYDRQLHEPVFDDRVDHTITPAVRVVITEGNYLLLDQEPWPSLARVLDECWYLDTPMQWARQWMVDRHVRGGRGRDDAQAHYEISDALNAKLVLQHMRKPDLTLCWPEVD